jgi:hypothetical protein
MQVLIPGIMDIRETGGVITIILILIKMALAIHLM